MTWSWRSTRAWPSAPACIPRPDCAWRASSAGPTPGSWTGRGCSTWAVARASWPSPRPAWGPAPCWAWTPTPSPSTATTANVRRNRLSTRVGACAWLGARQHHPVAPVGTLRPGARQPHRLAAGGAGAGARGIGPAGRPAAGVGHLHRPGAGGRSGIRDGGPAHRGAGSTRRTGSCWTWSGRSHDPSRPIRRWTSTRRCLFCRIAAGEIPATLIHDDELVIAFPDIAPRAPTHILLVPRRAHRVGGGAHGVRRARWSADLFAVAAQVARDAGHRRRWLPAGDQRRVVPPGRPSAISTST